MQLLAVVSVLLCLGLNDPGKNPGELQMAALALRPACWFNWAVYSEKNLDDPTFTPMLWKVSPGAIKLAERLAGEHPGRIWLVYNEPEQGDQANTAPAEAAEFFNAAYAAIKAADATAIVACCGNIVGERGLKWLEAFVTAGGRAPDRWHVHIYVWGAAPAEWDAFMQYWLRWNQKQGGNRPFYVTETCGIAADEQARLLQYVAAYEHPLLERVYWFSAFPEPMVPTWRCNLLTMKGERTALGVAFAALQSPTPTPAPSATMTPTATATATATATPTATLSPTVTPTPVPTATMTPTATPAFTPILLPTVIPTVTPTPVPTATITPTATLVPTAPATVTPTLVPTVATPCAPTVIDEGAEWMLLYRLFFPVIREGP